jgi:hypothetical protein
VVFARKHSFRTKVFWFCTEIPSSSESSASRFFKISMYINFDNELGTGTKPPRLEKVEDVTNWKDRMRSFCYYNDFTMLCSIQQGPHVPIIFTPNGPERNNDQSKWTDEDRNLVLRDFKALSALEIAITTPIYNVYGFDKLKYAKGLWMLCVLYLKEMKISRKEEKIWCKGSLICLITFKVKICVQKLLG